MVRRQLGNRALPLPAGDAPPDNDLRADIAAYMADLMARWPALTVVRDDLLRAYRTLVRTFDGGGTLFLCGNGGSFSDALHISGELLKSFERPRPLPAWYVQRLNELPGGAPLAASLQSGLRSIVLGANIALASAVQNDFAADRMGYAQELLALARPGDALLGISSSGNAQNVLNAVLAARALGLPTLLLTGETGGRIAPLVDVAVRVPAQGARGVQELHLPVYHALCAMLELHYFPA